MSRSCFKRKIKPFSNSDYTEVIQEIFVSLSSPTVPFLHSFGSPIWFAEHPCNDPIDGHVGLIDTTGTWVDGATPPAYIADGDFCGSERVWSEGAIDGIDAPLTWLDNGQSTCCREDTDFIVQENRYFVLQEDDSKLIWS